MSYTITPTTVKAPITSTPKGLTTNRRAFYADGYFYVFYKRGSGDDERIGYNSAPKATMIWGVDASVPDSPTEDTVRFSLWYDYTNNRVHLCWSLDGNVTAAMYYKMGTPSGGSITWYATVELDYTPNTGGVQACFFPSIGLTTLGYPIISYIYADDGSYSTHVCRSMVRNGTWSEKPGWPLTINAGAGMHTQVIASKWSNDFHVFGREGTTLRGYKWTNSTSTLTSFLTQTMHDAGWFNAINVEDDVHLVYCEEASAHLIYRKYVVGVGWSDPVHVHASAVASPCVCRDRGNDDIYCIWFDSPTSNAIYYSVLSGGSWSDAVVLATDPTFYDASGVYYQNCFPETPAERYIGITWPISQDGGINCRFGFIEIAAPASSMSITSVAPDESEVSVAGLSVVITGVNLTAVTSVSFGLDITVNSFVVDSATQITANIDIDWDATLGHRTVTVSSDVESASLTDGFEIISHSPSVPGVAGTPLSVPPNPPGNEWTGNIYSTHGDYVGSIGGWLSLHMLRRVNTPDRMELKMDGRHPAITYLSTDCIVEFVRSNSALGIAAYKETEGLFRNPLHDWDERGQYIFTGEFIGYEDLLDRRILLGGDDESFAAANLPAETVMKKVVEVQCSITGTRNIMANPLTGFVVEHSMDRGPTYKGYSKGQRLLTYLQDIADARNMAFRVMAGPTPATFKFRCHPNPFGADRTIRGLVNGRNSAGNYPVVFSEQRRNVTTMGYHIIHDAEGNIAIDENLRRVTVGPGAYDSPWSASEFMLNIGPDENSDAVADRDMAKMIAREEAQVQVIQTPSCCYGRHYFLGDWVTVYIDIPGMEKAVTKAITEVDITVENRQGMMAESVQIVLSDRPIPLKDPLQESMLNIVDRIAKAERRLP